MDMAEVKYAITGVAPGLLMHNAESMMVADKGALKGGGQKADPGAGYEKSMYLDDTGNLYLPSAAFRNALIAGSKGRKIGKVGAAGVVAGSVFPVVDRVTLLDPKTKKPLTKSACVEDKRSAVNNNCKPPARILAVRPKVEKWACVLLLSVDLTLINLQVLDEIIQIAGKIIGVGAFRVEKKGTFGRFDAKRES